MAIMASSSHKAIWPLWRQRWSIWVFLETAIKMWQSDEDGKSILPLMRAKMIQWHIFLCIFRNSFVNAKNGGHNSKMVEIG
jgi:hypothetical protein